MYADFDLCEKFNSFFLCSFLFTDLERLYMFVLNNVEWEKDT